MTDAEIRKRMKQIIDENLKLLGGQISGPAPYDLVEKMSLTDPELVKVLAAMSLKEMVADYFYSTITGEKSKIDPADFGGGVIQ